MSWFALTMSIDCEIFLRFQIEFVFLFVALETGKGKESIRNRRERHSFK